MEQSATIRRSDYYSIWREFITTNIYSSGQVLIEPMSMRDVCWFICLEGKLVQPSDAVAKTFKIHSFWNVYSVWNVYILKKSVIETINRVKHNAKRAKLNSEVIDFINSNLAVLKGMWLESDKEVGIVLFKVSKFRWHAQPE